MGVIDPSTTELSTTATSVVLERDGRLRRVVIDRPARRNSLRPQDLDQLLEALASVGRDEQAGALILGGRGGWLCAGGDLADETASGPREAERYLAGFQAVLRALLGLPIAVVTVLEGAAVGAGVALALAADVCVASPDSRLALPSVARGFVPDAGVAYFLGRQIGPARAKSLLLGSGSITAAQAHDWGLITEVDADPWAVAEGWAQRLASGPPMATLLTKRLVNEACYPGLSSFLELERSSMAAAMGTDEPAEGIAAFRERRTPKFVS